MGKMTKKTEEKRERILKAALVAAEKTGYSRITRDDVAEQCGRISASIISWHFRTMRELREETVRQAVKEENLIVLAQALGNGDHLALSAPLSVKMRAVELIKTRAVNAENGKTPCEKYQEARCFATKSR